MTAPLPAGSVYGRPLLYDIAFSYRDIAGEVDALGAWFRRATGRDPRSVLELASGPADHAIEWSRRGASAAALDLSDSMCAYAAAKAEASGAALRVHCADMIDFSIDGRFDLSMLMINSVAHLYDLDSMVRHLDAVAAHTEPDGLYVLEVQHPRDFVGRGPRPHGVSQPWTIERFGIRVETRWGSPDDPYDPLRQVFDAGIEIRAFDGTHEEHVTERCPMRDWTLSELHAALRLSGKWKLQGQHGDFALDAPLDAASWRMILVLQKRA